MALTFNTLNQLETLLTSERITYKGSEVRALGELLNEIARERGEALKALRVVSQPGLQGAQSAYNAQASAGD